jgi:hypothetical protein
MGSELLIISNKTIEINNINYNMKVLYLLIVAWLCAGFPVNSYGQKPEPKTTTVTVGNYKVTEKKEIPLFSPKDTFYRYTVDILDEKIKAKIKGKKLFTATTGATYTPWHDVHLHKKEERDFYIYCQKIFKEFNLTDIEKLRQINIYGIINDDGYVTCSSLSAFFSLFDLFSADDLVLILEKINLFKYTTPMVINGKKEPIAGYDDIKFRPVWTPRNEEVYQEYRAIFKDIPMP